MGTLHWLNAQDDYMKEQMEELDCQMKWTPGGGHARSLDEYIESQSRRRPDDFVKSRLRSWGYQPPPIPTSTTQAGYGGSRPSWQMVRMHPRSTSLPRRSREPFLQLRISLGSLGIRMITWTSNTPPVCWCRRDHLTHWLTPTNSSLDPEYKGYKVAMASPVTHAEDQLLDLMPGSPMETTVTATEPSEFSHMLGSAVSSTCGTPKLQGSPIPTPPVLGWGICCLIH